MIAAYPPCVGACAEITVLLDATHAAQDREVERHGLSTSVRNSLSDAVRALKTAQEDA